MSNSLKALIISMAMTMRWLLVVQTRCMPSPRYWRAINYVCAYPICGI